jgi:hypothetical protein
MGIERREIRELCHWSSLSINVWAAEPQSEGLTFDFSLAFNKNALPAKTLTA